MTPGCSQTRAARRRRNVDCLVPVTAAQRQRPASPRPRRRVRSSAGSKPGSYIPGEAIDPPGSEATTTEDNGDPAADGRRVVTPQQTGDRRCQLWPECSGRYARHPGRGDDCVRRDAQSSRGDRLKVAARAGRIGVLRAARTGDQATGARLGARDGRAPLVRSPLTNTERETGTDEGPNDHDPPSAVVVTRHRGSRLSVPVTAAHRAEPGLSSMFVLPPAGGLGTLVRVHRVRSGNGRSAPGFAHSGRILPWAGQRRGAADDENRDCPEFVIGGDTGEPGAGIRRGRSARSAPRWCAAGPKAMGARSTTGRRKKRDMKNMRSTTNNTERTKGTSTKSTKGGRARLRRTSSTGHPSLAIHSVLRDDRNGRDVQRDYLSATAQAT